MGKPTKDEGETKLAAAREAISTLTKESTPLKNKCTYTEVRNKTNKLIANHDFKPISRSTIEQPKTPEWQEIYNLITEQIKSHGKIKKAADKGTKERIKELEELCSNQNTKLIEYLMTNEKLEMENLEKEQAISDLVDQLRDFKANE